jgi:hypothetical protein
MDFFLQILHYLNLIFGGAVLIIGFGAYIVNRSLVPLLLALGLAAVGPIETLLMRYLHLSGLTPEQNKNLIDKSTSLVYVILLLAAVLLTL